eukprot:GEMP01054097.1.p1 GENE.GEMP01054097.1~~GEMP01054097.1.p1  ORF type:complete len:356 (+),score=79.75 GEMP01054097.1:461-1528(+)
MRLGPSNRLIAASSWSISKCGGRSFGKTRTAETQPASQIPQVNVNDMAAAGRSMWMKLTTTQTEQVQAPPSILDRWQRYENDQSANRNSITQAADDAVEAVNARIAGCHAEIAKSVERVEKMRAQLGNPSAGNTSPRGAVHPRVEELREARDVALKHYDLLLNGSSGDSARHSDLEVKRLRVVEELAALKEKLQAEIDENTKELSVCEANGMIEESEILSMEAELNNCSFLEDAAACQTQVDMQLESYKGLEELNDDIKDLQRLISASSNQCALLEEAITQIDKCAGEEAVRNLPYLREVVVKFVEYSQRGDMTAATLLPVICTILGATEEEQTRLEQRFPSTWLYLHQSMGQFN